MVVYGAFNQGSSPLWFVVQSLAVRFAHTNVKERMTRRMVKREDAAATDDSRSGWNSGLVGQLVGRFVRSFILTIIYIYIGLDAKRERGGREELGYIRWT